MEDLGEFSEESLYRSFKSQPRVREIKPIFRKDILYRRTSPFSGAKVLKTKDGIISLIIYLLTGWVGYNQLMILGESSSLTHSQLFIVSIILSVLIPPLGLSFAFTSPLKNSLSVAVKKYPAYLVYNLILLFLALILVVVTVFLTFVGLCLGLFIGIALIFYILYKVLFAPGVIALFDIHPMDAVYKSFEITTKWEGIDFFIVYLIVFIIVNEANKFLIKVAVTYSPLAFILVLPLNALLFIIFTSITLYVASLKMYLKNIEQEKEETPAEENSSHEQL